MKKFSKFSMFAIFVAVIFALGGGFLLSSSVAPNITLSHSQTVSEISQLKVESEVCAPEDGGVVLNLGSAEEEVSAAAPEEEVGDYYFGIYLTTGVSKVTYSMGLSSGTDHTVTSSTSSAFLVWQYQINMYVTFIFYPADGYRITKAEFRSTGSLTINTDRTFSGTGEQMAYIYVDSSGPSQVTAFAEPISHTVTLDVNDSSYGSVSGGGAVNDGASHTITATPNAGYKFTNWTYSDGTE